MPKRSPSLMADEPSAALKKLLDGMHELIDARRTELAHNAQKPLTPRKAANEKTRGSGTRARASKLPQSMLN